MDGLHTLLVMRDEVSADNLLEIRITLPTFNVREENRTLGQKCVLMKRKLVALTSLCPRRQVSSHSVKLKLYWVAALLAVQRVLAKTHSCVNQPFCIGRIGAASLLLLSASAASPRPFFRPDPIAAWLLVKRAPQLLTQI